MNVLQVSKADVLGGAERIAVQLHEGFRRRGHDAWLAVGEASGDVPFTLQIPTSRPRQWMRAALRRAVPPSARSWKIDLLCRYASNPGAFRRALLGRDSFRYPGTWRLEELAPVEPDLIHCHNLHSSYFDLRALAWLARRRPIVLTLHDAWLKTGGCGHPLDCGRWQTGCGTCPHRDLYFRASLIDSTAHNWRRKRRALASARLHVITPSRRLMEEMHDSILEPAIVSRRVIPNGVDTATFAPAERRAARLALGIDGDALVVMHASHEPARNASKDFPTMLAAVERAAARAGRRVTFLAVGGTVASDVPADGISLRFAPFVRSAQEMARYYAAADVYLQGSVTDTFPNTVLEAMACGRPVVGTRVGGIPEQVVDGATGRLVPAADAAAMAEALTSLLRDPAVGAAMGEAARARVVECFAAETQVERHLAYYREILDARPAAIA